MGPDQAHDDRDRGHHDVHPHVGTLARLEPALDRGHGRTARPLVHRQHGQHEPEGQRSRGGASPGLCVNSDDDDVEDDQQDGREADPRDQERSQGPDEEPQTGLHRELPLTTAG